MFYRPPAAVRAAAFAVFAGLPVFALAAEETVAVPRSEWEALKREMAQMHRELKDLRAEQAAARPMALAVPDEHGNVANAAPAQQPEPKGLKAPLEALSKSLTELITPGRPGTNAITISGEAEGNWRWEDNSKTSGFDASFSPEFHWQLGERLSFDAKVDFALSSYEGYSNTKLDQAHLNWQVADQFTLILGKFRSPMNLFAERYDYAYINPLPDAPLGLRNGVLPESNVGVQLRGEFPLPYQGGAVTASLFAGNAPESRYTTAFNGSIGFPDVTFGRDNYSIGGRLGWQVCPHLELGYGIEYAKTGASYNLATPTAGLFLHSVDLAASMDALRGQWRLQAQYGWSELDQDPIIRRSDYSTTTSAFSTHHHAGYVQLSYRGREWESDFLNHLELIVRGDRQYFSGYQEKYSSTDPEFLLSQIYNYPRQEANRLTLGLDYWITEYTVLKAAYEYAGGSSYFNRQSSVILGFATGL